MGELFAEIAVLGALDRTLHYLVPPHLCPQAQIGARALVPLGKREASGLIVALQTDPPDIPGDAVMRPLLSLLDSSPILPPALLDLCQWISDYYFYPLGDVLLTALPSPIQNKPLTFFRPLPFSREALKKRATPEMLSLLSQCGRIGSAEIDGTESPKRILSELKALEKEGLIERFCEWQVPKAHPKRVKHVRLVGRPDSGQIDANENLRFLIDLLKEAGGELPLRRLRHCGRNLEYWVRKLRQTGVLQIEVIEELRESHCAQDLAPAPPPELTTDQHQAVEAVLPFIRRPSFQPFLIHGVTGSGKTEIYLRLVEETARQQRGSIVLVPEIALSSQIEAIFRQRFGSGLAVWHSGLSDGARFDQWREILSGKRRIVLGVRSAIFMPVSDPGLIIVDEEHDPAYKQDDRLRYHARDVALMRASMAHIPIVLGSATPSLQSVHHAASGRYKSLSLPGRVLDRPLPGLQMVDMRRESGQTRILSTTLRNALAETVQKGEQALVFLNRRGFATFLLCHVCGHVLQCPHCSVSLTYHQTQTRMLCHYCASESPIPELCPTCGGKTLIKHGFGTERVEKEIKEHIPGASVVRIDRDTVSHSRDLVNHLNSVRQHKANVLIGTQMIAKGHDFPNITLVGIVNADTALQIADFRAGEATVQMLMQVAGRAGRGDKPGRVIIQTYNPAHYTIQSVLNMNYDAFCSRELESREQLKYPPFVKLLRLLVTAPREEITQRAAQQLGSLCRELAAQLRSSGRHVAVLGPTPAPLVRIKRRFRWQIFIKAWTSRDLQQFTGALLAQARTHPDLRRPLLSIDRDPMSSL